MLGDSKLVLVVKTQVKVHTKSLEKMFHNIGKWEEAFFFFFFRAVPLAYGDSQGRGIVRATAASLHQSHSNARSEPHL